jgi:hypothetical protein
VQQLYVEHLVQPNHLQPLPPLATAATATVGPLTAGSTSASRPDQVFLAAASVFPSRSLPPAPSVRSPPRFARPPARPRRPRRPLASPAPVARPPRRPSCGRDKDPVLRPARGPVEPRAGPVDFAAGARTGLTRLSAAKRGTMTLGKPRICGRPRCPMRVSCNSRRL